MRVLGAPLKRPGDPVTREELRAEIWTADTFVDFDHSLHNAIARIRETLGDSAGTPRYIETLPRRGYRFIKRIDEVKPERRHGCLSLSPATINLHLSAIRRLADEAAESGWLSSELAIGIRRVKGVKRLGRRVGNWLTGDQAQGLLNAITQSTLRGRRDAALIGLLLGCGLRRSEAVNLRFDQLQLRESHWGIVDMVGKGGRLRTVPVPHWCKGLIDVWLRDSRVTEGKVFRRVSKSGARQDAGVITENLVRIRSPSARIADRGNFEAASKVF